MQNNRDNADFDNLTEYQDAPYLHALQLNSQPFSSATSSDAIYTNEDRKQYLNHLLHIVQSSDLIQVVVGATGSGKSTLLTSFIQHSGPSLRCCPIQANAELDEASLLQALASCLDLPAQLGSSALLELLWEESFNLQRKDLLPVVLIDDAHRLPDKTLSILLQLQSINSPDTTDNSSPWRIILFTEAEHTVPLLELDTRLHFIELDGLTEQQTADYLEHRLKASGLTQPSPFSTRDIAFIHKHAQGNLNRIHQLAHQVLVGQFTKQQSPATATVSRPTEVKEKKHMNFNIKNKSLVLLSAAVVVVLIIVLMFQDSINELVEPEAAKTTAEKLALPQPEDFQQESTPDPVAAGDVATPVIAPDTETTAPAATQTESAADNLPRVKAKEDLALLQDQQPKPAANETAPQSDNIQGTSTPASPAPTKTADKSDHKTPQVADSLDSRLSTAGIKSREWILQQPATNFSAQLMGSSQPETLIKVASQTALKDRAAIYKRQRNNKDWFVLVYGSEPSRSAMQTAIKSLPASLQRNKPWVRPMTTIQAEVQSDNQ